MTMFCKHLPAVASVSIPGPHRRGVLGRRKYGNDHFGLGGKRKVVTSKVEIKVGDGFPTTKMPKNKTPAQPNETRTA